MKIGIDCRNILNNRGEMTGVGQYVFYLVCNLLKHDKKNQYVLFFNDEKSSEIISHENSKVQISIFPASRFKKFLPFLYAHFFISTIIKKMCDICIFPANIIPFFYNGKSVVVVHDLAIYKHAEWFENKQFFSKNILVPRSLKKADKIIAVSANTKKDIIENFNTFPSKILVVYPAACIKKSSEQFSDLPTKYFLYLGSLEPRKNILFLLNAFEKFRQKNNDYQLVLAGGKGWKNDLILDKIRHLQKNGIVKYLGYVSQEQKSNLLINARAFIFPSLYEGFGLPVLESLSVSTPVIVSKNSSLPEVAGSAGIYIDPQNEKDLINAFNQILDDDFYVHVKQKSFEQSQNFSWKKTALKLKNIVEKICYK